MSRAKKFLDEALVLIGEADEPTDDTVDFTDDGTDDEQTAPEDDSLDLGAVDDTAPPEDDFGLGGTASTAPSVRIEKDGPITVNKGEVQLTIGDDGAIDISLDGGGMSDLPAPSEPAGDMTDKPAEEEPTSGEDDAYNIDWDKEKEKEPKESFTEGVDQEGQTMINLSKQQSPATTDSSISKAKNYLNMESKRFSECADKKYECMSCDSFDECDDKYKKKANDEDEKDFLTQGYM